MSKRFTIGLMAAMFIVPLTVAMSFAEESQSQAKQGCCDKEKSCCDKNKECDSDCKCTSCKCKDCKNADCDVANCKCEGCEKAACKCAATACAKCDASSCRGEANDYAGCSGADCAAGQCCNESSCEAKSCAGGLCAADEPSALRFSGFSLLDISIPPSTSAVSDETWQLVAEELNLSGQPGHCHAGACQTPPTPADTATRPKPSVYLVLDNEAGGDYVVMSDCNGGMSVGSVLRGAVLPHPVNFAKAEIVVQRPTDDGNLRELPVQWDDASGQPTKCTDHALQANDRVRVKLAGSSVVRPHAVATAYSQAATAPRCSGGECREAGESTDERAAQIQYSIQIIEDSCGCMGEYESLRQGSPMMFAESKTLLPAMRILAKQQCIKQLSSPKLMCTAGQTAQLEIGSETPDSGSSRWQGLRLEVGSEQFEDCLKVELAMHSADDMRRFEVRTTTLVDEGQTIVLNASAGPQRRDDAERAQPAMYIVLTPQVVK